MSEASKYREFIIGYPDGETPFIIPDGGALDTLHGAIHTIEISALHEAQAEIKRLRGELKEISDLKTHARHSLCYSPETIATLLVKIGELEKSVAIIADKRSQDSRVSTAFFVKITGELKLEIVRLQEDIDFKNEAFDQLYESFLKLAPAGLSNKEAFLKAILELDGKEARNKLGI